VNAIEQIRKLGVEMVVAFQFLTRIPMPSTKFEADSLARAVKFFPLVGLVIGAGAVLVQKLLISHLGRPLVALAVLTSLVMVTGCLHEDGVADVADGFGGGWTKDQILLILKDSRIGSYGATALTLSLLARYLLLVSLPTEHFAAGVPFP
jgi:adenosylcobinamide-GDP ribazoletransferase